MRPPDWLTVAALAVLVVTASRTLQVRGPADVYVWAATELYAGRFGAHVWDDASVSAAVERATGGRVRDILSPSPPTLPLLLVPIARSPEHWRATLWTAGNLLALGLGVALLMAAVRWPREHLWIAAPLVAALTLSPPFRENLARGQVYLWILLCFSLVIYGLATARDWPVWLGLGSALLLKAAGWPLWLVLLGAGRRRVLLRAGALAGFVIVASLPWIGWMTWWRYVTEVVPGWTLGPKAMVPAYQTLSGLLQRLTRFDPTWNPTPLVNLPGLAAVAWTAAAVAVVGTMMRAARQEEQLVSAAAAAVVATVFLSPLGEQYHYVPAVVSLVVAGRMWLVRPERPMGLFLAAAALLVYAPLPYENPALWDGAVAPLAYPRLWGGLLLWAAVMVASVRAASPDEAKQAKTVVSPLNK